MNADQKASSTVIIGNAIIILTLVLMVFFDVRLSNIEKTPTKVYEFFTGCHVPENPTLQDVAKALNKDTKCANRIADKRLEVTIANIKKELHQSN